MTISKIENFYLQQPEPNQGCYLALRQFILNFDSHFSEDWKYGLPYFMFKGKMFVYFWKDKKTNLPYLGFAKGSKLSSKHLISENRNTVRILNINPHQDLPIDILKQIFEEAMALY